MNVISAKTIELSPDITAANVLQRISGVSLERTNEGDGRYVILRGMDQRYNNTLINGSKIPSPDAGYHIQNFTADSAQVNFIDYSGNSYTRRDARNKFSF